jgi:hypothetical protein
MTADAGLSVSRRTASGQGLRHLAGAMLGLEYPYIPSMSSSNNDWEADGLPK